MIWCVEDDASIRDIEVYALTSTGFEARGFADGDTFWDALQKEAPPELVVLDVMLPGTDGIELLRRLRASARFAELPVVMATAKGAEYDKIQGLDLGADYYLTKPFEPKELLACVRMLTRRQPEQRASQNLEYGDLRLETDTFQLSCGERSVRLSRKEFDMLELLMRSREMVLTKENLILKLWGYESDAEDNNVEVYISFLRKKLDHLHSKVKIRTIRMVGYRLEQET